MSPDVAVSDCNFILDYFRISNSRLLFGGGISYSGHPSSINAHYTRQRMLKVFPQLQSIKVEYAWHGMLDMSMNRAPDFGRVDNSIYYLQGFSGHGMALTTMAGKLAAESIAAHSEKFDLFSRIKHQPFPGGALRTPLFVLAMLWYRLRDAV
jgi:gamma-glutamylputrescine oxidase